MNTRTKNRVPARAASFAVGPMLGIGLLCVSLAAGEPADLRRQSPDVAAGKERGCVHCHAGIEPMHAVPGVHLACVDCHGGNGTVVVPEGSSPGSEGYERARAAAHVAPRFPDRWWSRDRSRAANPERPYTLSLEESAAFIRFVNPGDLRVAETTCGPCHAGQVAAVRRSTMTTSSTFWTAAAYANGILPNKFALFGESYSADGRPQALLSSPTAEQLRRGALPQLLPLPRWEVIQPGEYFRAFERGGILNGSTPPEIGNPNPLDESGRPDIRLSNRGRGTGLRISPALINIHKTRLNDPHLSFFGTNDHPGDYRSSGCTGCHVVYANDRESLHSGPWSAFGHGGRSATADPTIRKDEPGHPIAHRLTRAIPTSQCMSCHMHQPNSFVNTYLGYTMWDYVTDGEFLWPGEQRRPTDGEVRASLDRNPEGAATRGLWGDPAFLERVSELNPKLRHTQFADYHGHGWIFRAVYKQDRAGNYLDSGGNVVPPDDSEPFRKRVHLKDIHLERGMHCVDCHFSRDSHGDGLLHGDYGSTIEIRCEDCHGTVSQASTLRTSGAAAPTGGTDLTQARTPFGQFRFEWRDAPAGRRLYQRSSLYEGKEWPVRQVKDTITPGAPEYNAKSARAKTLRRQGSDELAHGSERMTCDSCHNSWLTSCSGCHLPQEANVKAPMRHYEGLETRNLASYNPQVIRTDMLILGHESTVRGNRIAPVRSSSALVLSSTNANRQRFYLQQPPISAPGYSSQAFNPHAPHTVRSTETRTCTDCHVSTGNDNNAWMAGVLGQGTNFPNFIGRFAWVGLGKKGIEAVAVTEWAEPQPVLGSYLHRLAFPQDHAAHVKAALELPESHHHRGNGDVRGLQLRGEYLFTAAGRDGLRVFDVANLDNKDSSERIVTAPVSPLGQRTHVSTRNAMAVALPTTMPVAPGRRTAVEDVRNEERGMHPIYRYAFVADAEEGLVLVDVQTLTDGDPENNFLRRTAVLGKPAYNPEGLLTGARSVTLGGHLVYVGSDSGLVVLDFQSLGADGSKPEPRVVAVVPELARATAISVQFRYLFVTSPKGLSVVDVTRPEAPVVAANLPIRDARGLYVARTYAYVAAGAEGLIIVNVERPDRPKVHQVFAAGGALSDTWDVKVASTSSNLFAYVADGTNGLRVLELTAPDTVPGYLGFSPPPVPRLVAMRRTHGPALALSKGLDRDRAVDETGHQVSVFNRIGSGPLDATDMDRLYLRDGRVYAVSDEAPAAAEGAR